MNQYAWDVVFIMWTNRQIGTHAGDAANTHIQFFADIHLLQEANVCAPRQLKSLGSSALCYRAHNVVVHLQGQKVLFCPVLLEPAPFGKFLPLLTNPFGMGEPPVG